MTSRPLNLPELGLLIYLLRDHAQAEQLLGQLHAAQVADITASGVGSLRFVSSHPEQRLGERVASTQFLDEDGVPVLVSLYLDQQGNLFELDCWKVDDAPVRRIPAF
ncbi:hypothetical protein F0P96_19165 [Hymenobacter busanensis]|uniref:DUF6984 domain-containing protein n=1 Tax=Hymenobacter busanensis TaxID=2607656 RepID=A0A7L4ZSH7_9BACT|nr:hypothetical protein [Hymenobacter busanensis]KAA9325886.1 hypothetical protein F0P96_19165 [Hymenobacter busanensis]QHJ06274.1 hypothetical protein GUY19_02760 [Hymenobacter busanensis]